MPFRRSGPTVSEGGARIQALQYVAKFLVCFFYTSLQVGAPGKPRPGSPGTVRFVSVPSLMWRFVATVLALVVTVGCGTIDAGQDFQIAQVVFDENYYYCRVEPMLFAQRCGSGDPERDGAGACHFNVTTFTLQEYGRLVGADCRGGTPEDAVPAEARGNYQSAQRQMRLDPELAPLLNRPTRRSPHPRRIFEANSAPADIVREWATRFSSQ
jgi:hypothetical protein